MAVINWTRIYPEDRTGRKPSSHVDNPLIYFDFNVSAPAELVRQCHCAPPSRTGARRARPARSSHRQVRHVHLDLRRLGGRRLSPQLPGGAAGAPARGVRPLPVVPDGGDRQRVLRATGRTGACRVREGLTAGLPLRQQGVGSRHRAAARGRAQPRFPERGSLQGRGAGALPARLRGARGVLRVRVPADAWQGPPRSRALGGRPGGLPPAAAARFPLCGRIAEPRAADRRVPRRTGAPRSGARLQFVDRDAHDWRAARAAGDSPGALHRRAGVAPTGTPLRRRGEAVRAVRSDSRSAARAAAGPAAVGRRGAEAADRGVDPRQQPARGKRAGDDSRAGRRVDRGAAVSGGRPAPAEPLPPPRPELVALAAALPPGIKFGAASWTVDGWSGDVYHRSYRGAQPAARLEEYVRYPLFRTVGINSAFYESPSERILHAYARALPEGYSCVVKVWDRITARRFIRDQRWGPLAGQLNPDFLDARLFLDHVLAHYARAFSRHALCFVFQFQAMRGTDLLDAEEWAERLDRFFRQLPPDFRYAVEQV